MQVRCQNCQSQIYIDDEEGQFDTEAERCRNCGLVGELKCLHSTIATDVCVSCGQEFTEHAGTNSDDENEYEL